MKLKHFIVYADYTSKSSYEAKKIVITDSMEVKFIHKYKYITWLKAPKFTSKNAVQELLKSYDDLIFPRISVLDQF